MRILFVTNYYPPAQFGWGYMQLCEEVAEGLAERGHELAVLTSTHCDGNGFPRKYPVHRLLTLDPDWHNGKSAMQQFFIGRRQRERQAVTILHQVVDEFRPELIYFWHFVGLPRVLLQAAEQIPNLKVVYYLAGYHPELPDEYIAYWKAPAGNPLVSLLKQVAGKVALSKLAAEGKPISPHFDHVACVSRYVRDRLVSKGLISTQAVVIYNGVDLATFSPQAFHLPSFAQEGLRCIFAGNLKAEKGAHTIVEALGYLKAQQKLEKISLTILGGGPSDYRDYLKKRVAELGLEQVVQFRAAVPRDQVPQALGEHNVLVLPTEYEEPLARSMQEGMALGLLAIGTLTGGTGELLVHDKTGLAFEVGDPQSLAEQFGRALADPAMAEQLAKAGQQAVVEGFTIERTVERTERYLEGLVQPEARV